MLPNYAIEKIQDFIDCDGTQMIDIVTLMTALDALRKQVKHKPDISRKPLYKVLCPDCGRTLNGFENAPYCISCGQALDWEVNK